MDPADALVEVLRSEGVRVLATLARTVGDLVVAEDALSEATITALDTWPTTGIPDNPRAWLTVVARLRVRQRRYTDAYQDLAPVYSRFTEGFETPDLRAAKAFLDELPG